MEFKSVVMGKMAWLEKITKFLLLSVGVSGVVVIYGGFFFLLFNGHNTSVIPWYGLLSPWICIFFGLPLHRQVSVIYWFKRQFFRKK
ncbi:hypothetical protein [Shewanella woodyi]|uniref:Uncharacterized protein n=1 Tax=Shewanella woodyi (strain ATCC 51908 / MS32) TaxID=392500 RepID=B1KMT7_SHEWM|nr:hypothetical protein [Shewanella woodyi]ACA87465.1 conserved hypothetical protein [Shewanella woodyi ATCC 51908]